MKLSDAPTTQQQIEIAASASAVWAVISDLATPSATSTEFTGAEWVGDATEPAVGAQFVGHNSHPAIGQWSTTSTITECEPERVLTWTVGDLAMPAAVWSYRIDPLADGVRLTQHAQIGPGRSGLSYAIDKMPEKEDRIVARRLEEHGANMRANLEHIKATVEQGQ